MTKARQNSSDVTETCEALETTRVDREAGVVYGVKLLGLRSRNKRNYDTAGVRKTAVELLENSVICVDHPENPQSPRKYSDRLGVATKVRYLKGEGYFADVKYNPKHMMAEQFLWDAEHKTAGVGMSINARFRPGKTQKDGYTDVEALEAVRTVDLVMKPATTDSLFEQESDEITEEEDEVMDLKTLKEKHPDLVKELTESISSDTTEQTEVEQLRKDHKEAMEQLAMIRKVDEAKKLKDAIEAEFAPVFKDSGIAEDLRKECLECACEMGEQTRKKFSGLMGKLVPLVVSEGDDESEEDTEVDESEHEEEAKPPAYRPKRSGFGGSKIDFRKDILGLSK